MAIHRWTPFLFLLGLGLFGCKSNTDAPIHQANQGIFSDEQAWELRPHTKSGDAFRYYYVISEVVTGKNANKSDYGIQLRMESWMDFEWVNDSVMKKPARLKFTRVRFESQSSDSARAQVYDTEKDPTGSGMDWAFRNMLGIPFYVEFDANGMAQYTRGLGQVMADIYPDTLYSPNDHFTETLNLDAIFPGRAVRIGETWTSVLGRRAQYPFFQDAVYELQGVRENQARVLVTADIRPNPKSLPVIEGGIPVKYELSGNKVGEYEVNRERGFVERSRTVYRLTGTRTLIPNDSTRKEGTVSITRIESMAMLAVHKFDSTLFPKVVPRDTLPTDTLRDSVIPKAKLPVPKPSEISRVSHWWQPDTIPVPRPPLQRN